MQILYSLVRLLKIDSREVFNPEMQLDSPELRKLRMLIDSCTEDEAEAVYSVVQAAIQMLRNNQSDKI